MQYNIAYGPYGELTHITDKDGNSVSIGTNQKDNSAANSLAPLRFLYNGQLGVQTDQNGLYYMRARYYNQDIKRFINRDTVSGDLTNSQSLNRYAYVQGNPINQTDPFGLYPIGDVLNILSQAGHMILDAAGFFWDGFDLINAAWYQAEGNELMAMTSAVSAIPFMGSMAAGGTRLAFKGSKAAKAASKAADYITNLSKLAGFTGQGTISAIDTHYAWQDCISAIENGTATSADMQDLILNALSTFANTVCAVSLTAKMTTRVKTNGVGDAVKASAKENMSGSKGSSGTGASAGKGSRKGTGFYVTSSGTGASAGKRKSGTTTLKHKASSGAELKTTPGKTTTILGRYEVDTGKIISELDLPKSTDFNGNPGGFNLLNTPNDLYVSANQFWDEYNKPFLDNAIARDDIIIMATEPTWDKLTYINEATSKTKITGFGREYTYLKQNGYKYDPITKIMTRR